MKLSIKYQFLFAIVFASGIFLSCDDDDNDDNTLSDVTYEQEDQMGRPGISTVFVTSSDKDMFNTTLPEDIGASFSDKFETQLMALNPGYTTNLLTLDAPTFASVLASDVLNVATNAPTTYYDGTNVLTGRKLDDDVIDVSLILIFGGPDAMSNAALTSDHVNANDKSFLGSFPYLAEPH